MGWGRGPARFTLCAHNLLDERYFTSGGSSGDTVNVGWRRQLMLIASYVYNKEGCSRRSAARHPGTNQVAGILAALLRQMFGDGVTLRS